MVDDGERREEGPVLEATTDELSRVFQALADPTRRDLVARLAQRDATVGELAAPYAVSLQAVSKHLKVLEEAGLVSRSREAQRRPVHLEAEVLDLMTKWIERYQRQAEERYARLRRGCWRGWVGSRQARPAGAGGRLDHEGTGVSAGSTSRGAAERGLGRFDQGRLDHLGSDDEGEGL